MKPFDIQNNALKTSHLGHSVPTDCHYAMSQMFHKYWNCCYQGNDKLITDVDVNIFRSMIDRRMVLSLISSCDNCQRFSPSQTSCAPPVAIRLNSCKMLMASFDIESLFTNIPLQETIGLCVENLFQERTHVDNLLKDSFFELFTRTMSESLILFDQQFYKQHDGVAIGSPLGPTLANVFLCYHEKIWLQNCSSGFKPVIYRRHVDDTFLLFCSKHHITLFKLSTQKHQIHFLDWKWKLHFVSWHQNN